MDKIKVRIEAKRSVYIHNDLGNCAYHFKERFENWGDQGGMALEIMAGLTMIAFTAEARFNFLGWKLISDWNENQTLKAKAKNVTKKLGLKSDFGQKPYSTIKSLKEFRDTLAHGKPIIMNEQKEIVTTHQELEERGFLKADWERFLTLEFFTLAYEQTEDIWNELLKASDLEVFDTLSGGQHSIVFLAETK